MTYRDIEMEERARQCFEQYSGSRNGSPTEAMCRFAKSELVRGNAYTRGKREGLIEAAAFIDAPFGDKPERKHLAHVLRDMADKLKEAK